MDEYVRIPKDLLTRHVAAVDEFATAVEVEDRPRAADAATALADSVADIRAEMRPL